MRTRPTRRCAASLPIILFSGSASARLSAFGWADGRRLGAQLLDVRAVDHWPAFCGGPRRFGAVERLLERVEACVPAGRIARRFAQLRKGVQQGEPAAIAVGCDFE